MKGAVRFAAKAETPFIRLPGTLQAMNLTS